MGKKNRSKIQWWESGDQNNKTYVDIYNQLMELALNVFHWENLPDTVDERFLELTLYEKGYALWFKDEVIGDLALTCTIGGRLDVYRIPIERRAFANNGYFAERDASNSVLIFNNYLHTPTHLTIAQYARRLYEIQRAIDTNVKAQKTPILVLASEQQRLTMKNLYMDYDGNEPFIFGDKNLEYDNIKAMNTNAPFVADKLKMLYHQTWNEALTFIGIENSNQDKKERLVKDEVGSNYGNVEAQRNVKLNARQQAADKINRMFGHNIKPVFNSDLRTMVNMPELVDETINVSRSPNGVNGGNEDE